MTSRPHDALFRSAFEQPAHAAGTLRHVLAADLAAAVDWHTLRLEPGSFIDPELADHHTDLLFSARVGGAAALIYVLLEHQSTVDRRMPLRMLVYMARIWERHVSDAAADAPLPAVVPVLMTHARGEPAPTRMHELIDPAPAEVPGLARRVPEFEVVVDDLAAVSNEDLRARSLAVFPMLALWLLRDGRDPAALLRNLGEWAEAFHAVALAPDGFVALHKLLRYVDLVTSERHRGAFYGKLVRLAPATEEVVMNYGDRFFAEGKAEGRAEGRLDAQRGVVAKLLALKFGPLDSVAARRVSAASSDELERWIERVLTASELAAVFET